MLGIASRRRVAYLPDVATFAEQGFAGLETGTWFALFAPRGTPEEIVEQLNGYVRGLSTIRIRSAARGDVHGAHEPDGRGVCRRR